MKIAAKHLNKEAFMPSMLFSAQWSKARAGLFMALFFTLSAAPVFAADVPPPAATPGITAASAPAVTTTVATTTSVAAPADAPKIIPPAGAMDSSSALAAAMPDVTDKNDPGNKGGNRGLAAAEEKITDTAKATVKRLNAADNLTLDDLNAARQAVAKIDALIDIEKRLNELQKLRAERDDKSLEGALPASALSPMPMRGSGGGSMSNASMPTMTMNVPSSNIPMMTGGAMQASVLQSATMGSGSLEVSRIIGSNGSYTAVIKTPDGQTHTVERGDHLPEGDVEAITSAGVLLEHNGSKHLIHVKNIETVFGYNP
jgi:type IV pilus biogenesis protein PilP